MKQTLTFIPSVIASTQSKMNPEAFDKSDEAYDNGQYLESFYQLLDYANPEFRSKYGNAQGTEFHIPHGSIIVTLRLDDGQLHISAPFLGVPEKGRVPLLRQVVTLNFVDLDLAQIVLRDDKLYFEYSCPQEAVNPYKIYYILQEICRCGDRYDDEFETKFGAERIYEPEVKPYEPQTIDSAYEALQLCCRECLENIKGFETNRQYGYAWNLIATTMLKIMYSLHPQGQFLNDMNKAIREHDREDIPLPEVVGIGREVIEKLQAMSKEELAEDLYFVETFIPTKRRSSLSNIQENFKGTWERASSALQNDDHMACCVLIIYKFYEMYHYNLVQDDINAVVVNALSKTSGMPFEEAAPILHAAIEKIMEDELEPEEEEEDSEEVEMNTEEMAQYMQQMQAIQQMQAAAMQNPAAIAQIQQAAMQAAQGDMQAYVQQMQQMMAAMTGGQQEEE